MEKVIMENKYSEPRSIIKLVADKNYFEFIENLDEQIKSPDTPVITYEIFKQLELAFNSALPVCFLVVNLSTVLTDREMIEYYFNTCSAKAIEFRFKAQCQKNGKALENYQFSVCLSSNNKCLISISNIMGNEAVVSESSLEDLPETIEGCLFEMSKLFASLNGIFKPVRNPVLIDKNRDLVFGEDFFLSLESGKYFQKTLDQRALEDNVLFKALQHGEQMGLRKESVEMLQHVDKLYTSYKAQRETEEMSNATWH